MNLMNVISFSGRKRKIKAETFSQSLAKAACFNGEGKALCIACNHIHTVYDHNNNNNVCQASTLSSEEITKIKRVFVFLNSKTGNVEFPVDTHLILRLVKDAMGKSLFSPELEPYLITQ